MQKTLKRYFPIFVLPTLIAFSFAFIIPFVMGVYLSFCKFKTITNAQFVGLDNYIKIFADKDFVNAFGFTLKFSVVSIVTIMCLPSFWHWHCRERSKEPTCSVQYFSCRT